MNIKENIVIAIIAIIISAGIMLLLKLILFDNNELKIDNLELIIENGTRMITGEVKNTLDKDIKYIEVELQMIDDEGIVLNDACNLGSLKQSEKWRFTFYLFYYEFDYCNVKISKMEYK